LKSVIDKFKVHFVECNEMLLSKAPGQSAETGVLKQDYVVKTVTGFINLTVQSLIEFYSLHEEFGGTRDLRRELLINLVTNFVLQKDLYFLVQNVCAVGQEAQIQKMHSIMQSKSTLENHLNFANLGVAP
jgi:hypothetical protein